jgi:hypothetical protein
MEHQDQLLQQENRRIRLLRITTDFLIQMLMKRSVMPEDADRMIRGLREFALKLFPGRAQAFDLIYLPRFRRAMLEAGYTEISEVLKWLDAAHDRAKASRGSEQWNR